MLTGVKQISYLFAFRYPGGWRRKEQAIADRTSAFLVDSVSFPSGAIPTHGEEADFNVQVKIGP